MLQSQKRFEFNPGFWEMRWGMKELKEGDTVMVAWIHKTCQDFIEKQGIHGNPTRRRSTVMIEAPALCQNCCPTAHGVVIP